MVQFTSLLLSAIAGGFFTVAAEVAGVCGDSTYLPSQYTCFDDDFLCPIIDGDIYLRCGDACYSTGTYSCSDDNLVLVTQDGTLEDCGDAQFSPSEYVCLDGDFLCPIIDGSATLRCGDACYEPSQYTCTNGALSPVTTPSCVPNFGDSEVCTSEGCLQLLCCPGLISIATKCRDPCELVPSSCASSAPVPRATSNDTCVPDFGDSEVCNSEGCFQLVCCPGLISVADKCRDPCDVDPASCASTSST